MSISVVWFAVLVSLSILGWVLGWQAGKLRSPIRVLIAFTAVGLIVFCGYMTREPYVPLSFLPTTVVSAMEGVSAVPFFMLLMGLGYARSNLPRHKRLTLAAMAFGAVYFFTGGFWMIQTSPAPSLAHTVGERNVLQTENYTCVPAACATALNRIGIKTSEAEMADLTFTRPGTGSTLVRALGGIQRKLELVGSARQAKLIRVEESELNHLPMPILTALAYEPTKHHMVVILKHQNGFYRMVDPQVGEITIHREELVKIFTGNVIIIR